MPSEGFCRARRKTRGLAAPLAALAPPNPALSVTALAVTGRAGVHLAAASAAPGAGFASRGIVMCPAHSTVERKGFDMKPRAGGPIGYILLAVSSLLLTPSCGDDDGPATPDLASAYLIQASLVLSTETATITVSRLDANDPSAASAVVLLDGHGMQHSVNNTPDLATFLSQVPTDPGHAYAFSVTIDGINASGTLATPNQPCTLAITQPPPGNLTFSSTTDIDLQWTYSGSDPGEFGIFGTTLTFPPVVVSETLDPSARATAVETSQWSFAPEILLRVTARARAAVSGDLAAQNSSSTVEFASSQVALDRR